MYVGVSAGAFIASGLANGLTPGQLCRMFIDGRSARVPFNPSRFLMPAYGEFLRRSMMLPTLMFGALRQMLGLSGQQGDMGEMSVSAPLAHLTRALPSGIFDNEVMRRYLQEVFEAHGGSDDFRALRAKLFLVATDLDTGEAAPFGMPGWDDVPISRAVIASAALPGLYPPVKIHGRDYVDGALKKTVHASVLLDQGLDLLFCLNPLVPFDASRDGASSYPPEGQGIPRLDAAGLPTLLSQTFRSLIHSRLELGMKGYERSHPDCDIVLFEPDHGDAEMFHAGTFSYAMRRRLANHAFQQTRRMLRERQASLAPRLARHGLALREEWLHEPHQLIPLGPRPTPAEALVGRTHQIGRAHV